MTPDAKIKASGLKGLLLVPFRARDHITEKLGAGWAIAADVMMLGGGLGLLAALALDVSGEAKLGIFAGVLAAAAIAGAAIGARRKAPPKQRGDTQP